MPSTTRPKVAIDTAPTALCFLQTDSDKDEAEALRSSVVAPAQRSKAAVSKQTTGVTPDGLPVHSFRTLLADLATLACNTIITAFSPDHTLAVLARPTPIQRKAFELLRVAA